MSYHYPNDGVRCPFGKSDFCSKDWCAMWNDDSCLVRQTLIRYLDDRNKIIPNDTDDEEIKAKIEKLKKQNEMLSMGFSIFQTMDGSKEKLYGY